MIRYFTSLIVAVALSIFCSKVLSDDDPAKSEQVTKTGSYQFWYVKFR